MLLQVWYLRVSIRSVWRYLVAVRGNGCSVVLFAVSITVFVVLCCSFCCRVCFFLLQFVLPLRLVWIRRANRQHHCSKRRISNRETPFSLHSSLTYLLTYLLCYIGWTLPLPPPHQALSPIYRDRSLIANITCILLCKDNKYFSAASTTTATTAITTTATTAIITKTATASTTSATAREREREMRKSASEAANWQRQQQQQQLRQQLRQQKL